MELRSLLRRYSPDKPGVRVLAKNGGETIGHVLDLNQKGFRITTKSKFPPGSMLDGLIEFISDTAGTRLIPVHAKCIWNDAKECGFSIKEIPLAEETALDQLIEQLAKRKK